MPFFVINVAMESHHNRYFNLRCYASVILCQNNKNNVINSEINCTANSL